MRPLDFLSVCSGLETPSLAWDGLGFNCVGVSEVDPFPCHVLQHRFGAGRPRWMLDPNEATSAKERRRLELDLELVADLLDGPNHLPNYGDFRRIEAEHVGPIGLLVGGTPCQDFSVAGLRAGLAGSRGVLTLEFLKLAGRLRPRWVVWENVAGALYDSEGRAFGAIAGGLQKLGYSLAWRVLDTQYVRVDRFGRAIPQRRRRVFIVGYLGTDWRRPAAVLFERAGLSGDPLPRRAPGETVAGTVGAGSQRCGPTPEFDRGQLVPEVAGTIASSGGRGVPGDNVQDAMSDLLIPEVSGTIEAAAARSRGAGTSPGILVPEVSGPLGGNSEEAGYRLDLESGALIPEVANPLTARMGKGPNTTLDEGQTLVAFNARQDPIPADNVAVPLDTDGFSPAVAFSSKDHGQDASLEVAPTVRSGAERGANPNAGVPPAIAFAVRGREGGADIEESGEVSSALRSAGGGSTRDYVAVGGLRYVVRRLTPLECERLQGLPDNFTLVPWGKGMAPDGRRYKAIGNGMSANVMRWIGTRIRWVEDNDDLFPAA